MIDEGVSASRVVFHRVCCSAANEHFRSVNFVTHTPPPPPPSPAYERNIRNITDWSLFLFNVTLVLSRSCIGNRGMHVRKRVYRSVREVYYFFFLFFSTPLLSLSFSHFFFLLCARVYRNPGFVWKKGRDTFLITSREPRLDTSIFGHWHATIFFFMVLFTCLSFYYYYFFFLLIFR